MLAFDDVYKLYSNRLFGFVLRYVKSETDAESIVQDVFVKIWETHKKIDPKSSFESYIFTIAYNSTISLLRKRISDARFREHLKNRQMIEEADSVIGELHYNELKTAIGVLLEQLTPRQKEIFLMSREKGFSNDEIAAKLNISSNTVKNHLVSALAFLRSKLNNGGLVSLLFIHLFL